MKVIKEGDKKIGKWWTGIILECKTCGRKVQLEENDENLAIWIKANSLSVQFQCSCCGDFVTYNRIKL